jgi:sporulation protein YlmC with PRC-barrel domain
MFVRHSLIAAAALCAIVPALAQDHDSSQANSELRATLAYPLRQEASQWLGSNLIGAKVISASNETVGKISNLIVNDKGAIESVIIAVGGVFGIGTKNVAVTYNSLNIVRNKQGDAIDHVTLAATKADLLQATEFKSLKRQVADAQAKR